MPGVVLAHRIPPELFKLYVERRYADVDPAMRMLRRTTEPFKWLDVPYDPQRERRGAQVMALVADFGLSQGFFVPTPSAAGPCGNVWMAGPTPELTARNKPALHIMALYAFDRGASARRPLTGSAGWSDHARARSVGVDRLREIRLGNREILGIGKRTVDEHVQTAVRKLGAANKTQAVVFAIRDGLIQI